MKLDESMQENFQHIEMKQKITSKKSKIQMFGFFSDFE